MYKRPIYDMSIQEITRIAEDMASKAPHLAQRIMGWNLICGLYSEPRSHEEDMVLAYAHQAREICVRTLYLTCARAQAGLKDNLARYERLGQILTDLKIREQLLSSLCRAAIRRRKADQSVILMNDGDKPVTGCEIAQILEFAFLPKQAISARKEAK